MNAIKFISLFLVSFCLGAQQSLITLQTFPSISSFGKAFVVYGDSAVVGAPSQSMVFFYTLDPDTGKWNHQNSISSSTSGFGINILSNGQYLVLFDSSSSCRVYQSNSSDSSRWSVAFNISFSSPASAISSFQSGKMSSTSNTFYVPMADKNVWIITITSSTTYSIEKTRTALPTTCDALALVSDTQFFCKNSKNGATLVTRDDSGSWGSIVAVPLPSSLRESSQLGSSLLVSGNYLFLSDLSSSKVAKIYIAPFKDGAWSSITTTLQPASARYFTFYPNPQTGGIIVTSVGSTDSNLYFYELSTNGSWILNNTLSGPDSSLAPLQYFNGRYMISNYNSLLFWNAPPCQVDSDCGGRGICTEIGSCSCYSGFSNNITNADALCSAIPPSSCASSFQNLTSSQSGFSPTFRLNLTNQILYIEVIIPLQHNIYDDPWNSMPSLTDPNSQVLSYDTLITWNGLDNGCNYPASSISTWSQSITSDCKDRLQLTLPWSTASSLCGFSWNPAGFWTQNVYMTRTFTAPLLSDEGVILVNRTESVTFPIQLIAPNNLSLDSNINVTGPVIVTSSVVNLATYKLDSAMWQLDIEAITQAPYKLSALVVSTSKSSDRLVAGATQLVDVSQCNSNDQPCSQRISIFFRNCSALSLNFFISFLPNCSGGAGSSCPVLPIRGFINGTLSTNDSCGSVKTLPLDTNQLSEVSSKKTFYSNDTAYFGYKISSKQSINNITLVEVCVIPQPSKTCTPVSFSVATYPDSAAGINPYFSVNLSQNAISGSSTKNYTFQATVLVTWYQDSSKRAVNLYGQQFTNTFSLFIIQLNPTVTGASTDSASTTLSDSSTSTDSSTSNSSISTGDATSSTTRGSGSSTSVVASSSSTTEPVDNVRSNNNKKLSKSAVAALAACLSILCCCVFVALIILIIVYRKRRADSRRKNIENPDGAVAFFTGDSDSTDKPAESAKAESAKAESAKTEVANADSSKNLERVPSKDQTPLPRIPSRPNNSAYDNLAPFPVASRAYQKQEDETDTSSFEWSSRSSYTATSISTDYENYFVSMQKRNVFMGKEEDSESSSESSSSSSSSDSSSESSSSSFSTSQSSQTSESESQSTTSNTQSSSDYSIE